MHCAAGVRVYRAEPILERMGFTNVIPLEVNASILAVGLILVVTESSKIQFVPAVSVNSTRATCIA